MRIDIIQFFAFVHLFHIASVFPEPPGGIGGRTLLFVRLMEKVVQVVQQFFHAGIVVLADLVAETVGADGGVGIGIADALFGFPDEFRKQISLFVAGSVESLDGDHVGAFRVPDRGFGIAEFIGDDDSEFVKHVVIAA